MSGFLPDIASWALGGGASSSSSSSSAAAAAATPAISEDEVRAKRMARLAGASSFDTAPAANAGAVAAANGGDATMTTTGSGNRADVDVDVDDDYCAPRPMEIDDERDGDVDIGGPAGSSSSSSSASSSIIGSSSSPPAAAPPSSSRIATVPSPQTTTTTTTTTTTKTTPPAVVVDPHAKHRRRKSQLLRRVLLVTYDDNSSSSDHHHHYRQTPSSSNCVRLVLDDDFDANDVTKCPGGVEPRHVAELLTARLSLSKDSPELLSSTRAMGGAGGGGGGLISYLGGCHRRAGEEMRELRQQSGGGGGGGGAAGDRGGRKTTTSTSAVRMMIEKEEEGEMSEILEQVKVQVVSYAASSLMVPDLFELGHDASLQLAKCLSAASSDPTSSITFDSLGKNTSFYHCLCEELHSQGQDEFAAVIGDVVGHIVDSLSKCHSLLDEGSTSSTNNDGAVGGGGLYLVSALRELCTNRRAASALSGLPSFLLPPPGAPSANERVETASGQQLAMMRMIQSMRGGDASRLLPPGGYHLRRSGPALEKDTILGLVLRLGLPTEGTNPSMPSVASSFSGAATRSRKDVSQIAGGFRRQLELYQGKCNELVRQLVVAGEESRKRVIQWLIDALLLNVAADAMRPDRSKVSSEELLMNLSVVLLKLCEPFIDDVKKAALVDPGFVCSPESHGGVYDLTGDNALPRLGENVTIEGVTYSPKNSFIPLCFFFCSRSLALSVVPGGSRYENIVRNVYHIHRTIRQQNGDPRSDPRFDRILQVQFSKEIVMMSPTFIADVARFYNMAAGILLQLNKDQLKTMPEHIVDDMCSVLVYASSYAGKLLAGSDFGNLFRLTVTLLSKDYSHLVRNYNLRAKLGDVLHDIFLPRNSDRHNEVPDSVTCDPLAGGQPYLTSDRMSKETLAPSLLLLYGEVENTGYYEKNDHRTKIAALLKFLWDSPDHKAAFKGITEDKKSFITFANGIVNEMNDKFASVMETLPSIRTVQVQMANPQEWAALSEEERETITARHESNEQQVKHVLPLCNSVMKMLGFLNTDKDIRDMFLLPDMCPRLANMLLHVLNKLVGSRGLDLKVDNPETYNFRPKEMLQDLCVVFSSFAAADEFQIECARSGYYTADLMSKSVKTCRKLGLLIGESMELFDLLAIKVEVASKTLISDEDLYEDAPDEFLDPLMQEFMTDPVLLPTSNNVVDRRTITHHLLNNDTDPFNRKQLSIDDVVPAVELKEKMKLWLASKRAARDQAS